MPFKAVTIWTALVSSADGRMQSGSIFWDLILLTMEIIWLSEKVRQGKRMMPIPALAALCCPELVMNGSLIDRRHSHPSNPNCCRVAGRFRRGKCPAVARDRFQTVCCRSHYGRSDRNPRRQGTPPEAGLACSRAVSVSFFDPPYSILDPPCAKKSSDLQFSQPVDGNTSFRQIRTAIVRW